jgi:nucleoside-diphosphate-sugar epimerase
LSELSAVTGAFGYIGKYITQRLLSEGRQVITLTNKPATLSPFGDKVKAYPLNFSNRDELIASLAGVETLYNTYWVRFNYRQMTFERAIHNSQMLLQAARAARVQRVVHISITNPDFTSPLPYFQGKAVIEEYLKQFDWISYIIRPTVVFGQEDILINNIAFLLRHSPVFAIPGSGNYRLQPIFVEDLARIAVQAGQSDKNQIIDAVGPDILSFRALVQLIAAAVGSRALIVPVPPSIGLFLSRMIGAVLSDVLLTTDELKGLMAELLISKQSPTGHTSIRDWLAANAETCGAAYASELQRHY